MGQCATVPMSAEDDEPDDVRLTHAALLGSPVPTLIADADGLVTTANRAATELFCGHPEIVGLHLQDLVRPGDVVKKGMVVKASRLSIGDYMTVPSPTPSPTRATAPQSAGNFYESPVPSPVSSPRRRRRHQRMKEGNPWAPAQGRIGAGVTAPLLMAVARVPGVGCVVSLQDLRSGCVDAATKSAFDANRELQVRDDRRRFIEYLSHEIRVPMHALSLGIGLLSGHQFEKMFSGSKRGENLTAVREHCDDLTMCCDAVLHLLRDVLDMEKMQNGLYHYDYGPVDMIALAKGAARLTRMAEQTDGLCSSHIHQSLSPKLASCRVWADGNRLLQVTQNFLSNAVKHAPSGASIRLSISCEERKVPAARDSSSNGAAPENGSDGEGSDGGSDGSSDGSSYAESEEALRSQYGAPADAEPLDVTIEVWNEGSKLPTGGNSVVFEPYLQLGLHSRDDIISRLDSGGEDGLPLEAVSATRTGTGLSIVKQVVCRGHCGSVWAESDDIGTTFRATLRVFAVKPSPVTEARVARLSLDGDKKSALEEFQAKAQRGIERSTSGCMDQAYTGEPLQVNDDAVDVLYIEDSALNRRMMERMLTRLGKTFAMTCDGREGVEWIEERGRGCRLVLVDRAMPVMDGLEAARRIKELFPDVPIVGLTADALPHEIASFVDSGAWFVLTKPVSNDELAATLNRFISSSPPGDDGSDGEESDSTSSSSSCSPRGSPRVNNARKQPTGTAHAFDASAASQTETIAEEDQQTGGSDNGEDVGADGENVGAAGENVGADGEDVGADGEDVGAAGEDVGAAGEDGNGNSNDGGDDGNKTSNDASGEDNNDNEGGGDEIDEVDCDQNAELDGDETAKVDGDSGEGVDADEGADVVDKPADASSDGSDQPQEETTAENQ